MSIFAIAAVDLFRPFGASGQYATATTFGLADATYAAEVRACDQNDQNGGGGTNGSILCAVAGGRVGGSFANVTLVSSITARGIYYGQEYYGTYSRALYTMFQVSGIPPTAVLSLNSH